jgi:hypothetical protein
MSRTTLCLLTAAVLAALSLGLMAVRTLVLGDEVRGPTGPSCWKVSLLVRGKSTGQARLVTACPLDVGRQQVFQETCRSDELQPRSPEGRHADRRRYLWLQRPGTGKEPFQARYDFYCRVDVQKPTAAMTQLASTLYAAPGPGECLQSEPRIDSSNPRVSVQAAHLAPARSSRGDQVRALYRFVEQQIEGEPNVGGAALSASECLKLGRGDAAARSRLLVAFCRNRGIPARLVTGLALTKGREQKAHTWVEAWVDGAWMPFCPTYHRCGRVPPTYLVCGFGDVPLARGQNVRDLQYACLVEHRAMPKGLDTEAFLHRVFARLSLFDLPLAERHMVEFLLLLPVAALVICLFRNVIGIQSFGTFAPALLGLMFRQVESLPGILVFLSIVLIGWLMRRVLDRYHLLQVPRTAFLLSLVVLVLLGAVVLANQFALAVTRYFSLFPMVILAGMIERFWTLESEDGTAVSFKTLVTTMLMAASISLLLSLGAVVNHMFRYPETLGLVMAAQLLIGRYTGYRLTELLRFRDFLGSHPGTGVSGAHKIPAPHFAKKSQVNRG